MKADVSIRPVENTDSAGLIDLIASCFADYPNCILDVDGEVWNGLGTVDETHGTCGAGHRGYLPDRIDGSESVGHVGDANESGPRAEQALVVLEDQTTVRTDVHVANGRARAGGEHQPRH